MASFETLLIKVRSETPTSFFFVVSKVAFLIFGLLLPDAAARPPSWAFGAFSPFGRRLIPYFSSRLAICARRQDNHVVRSLTILESSPGCRALLQDAPRSRMPVAGIQVT
jgi:hypothetical protein